MFNMKQWQQENRDKISKSTRKYYEKNYNKIRDRQKKYYQENKEKILRKHKEYRKENKEKVNQKHKEYRQKDKEKWGKYNREYRKKYRAKNKELWKQIIKEHYGKIACSVCGYNKCFDAIDFHHNGNKKCEPSSLLRIRPTPERIEELKKCDILCANCHREIHAS